MQRLWLLAILQIAQPLFVDLNGKGKFLLSGVHFELQPEIYEQYIIRDTLHLSEYILEQSIYNQIKQMDSNYIWKKIRRLLDKVSTI